MPVGIYRYRCSRNRVAVEAFGVLIVFLGLVLAAGNRPSVPLRLGGVGAVLIGIGLIWWGRRIGVDVEGSNVVVRGPLQTRVSKDDIVSVGTRRWFANHVVYLELRDGRRLDTNLIQGARVTWAGGQTSDILMVLATELGLPVDATH